MPMLRQAKLVHSRRPRKRSEFRSAGSTLFRISLSEMCSLPRRTAAKPGLGFANLARGLPQSSGAVAQLIRGRICLLPRSL